MKTMFKNRRRALAIVFTLALVVSLMAGFATTASAAFVRTYLTPASNTDYTTFVTAGDTVYPEIYFSEYDAEEPNPLLAWQNGGFANNTEADSVTWSVVSDPSGIINGSPTSGHDTEDSLITAKGTINTNTGVSGVAVVEATFAGGFYLDLTIVIDSPASPVTGVYVSVVDITGTTTLYVEKSSVAVNNASSGGTFYTIPQTAQNYPTAAGALEAIRNPSGTGTPSVIPDFVKAISIDGNNGYVNAVQAYDAFAGSPGFVTPTAAGWVGWNYCVIRSGNIVAQSQLVSAAVIKLQNNDSVIWAYGEYGDAQDYFESLV